MRATGRRSLYTPHAPLFTAARRDDACDGGGPSRARRPRHAWPQAAMEPGRRFLVPSLPRCGRGLSGIAWWAMFTGIVQHVGVCGGVRSASGGKRLTIDVGPLAEGLALGDSVAVGGACLTAAGPGRLGGRSSTRSPRRSRAPRSAACERARG